MDTFKKQYKIYNISSLANFQAYYTGNTPNWYSNKFFFSF